MYICMQNYCQRVLRSPTTTGTITRDFYAHHNLYAHTTKSHSWEFIACAACGVCIALLSRRATTLKSNVKEEKRVNSQQYHTVQQGLTTRERYSQIIGQTGNDLSGAALATVSVVQSVIIIEGTHEQYEDHARACTNSARSKLEAVSGRATVCL